MRVAIIGLGIIGSGAARCLARAGHAVVACDLRDDAFAEVPNVERATTPAQAADGADAVVIAVLNDTQVRAVVAGPDGVLAAERAPQVLILVSTVPLETVEWLERETAASSTHVVDCGVSGGPHALEAGSIVAMVGGDDVSVALARPVLEAFASPVIHMGTLGKGMAAKLGRNLLTFAQRVVAWESLKLAVAAGVDPDAYLEMVKASERWSTHTDWLDRGLGIDGREFDLEGASRSATYAYKDLAAALELGEQLKIDLPMAAKAQTLIQETLGLVSVGEGVPDGGGE